MLNLKQLLGLAIAAGLMISAPLPLRKPSSWPLPPVLKTQVCWVTCCQNLNLNQAIRYK